ncbi:zinc-dependent alcohol dehydrogenase family protein [Paenibacillus cisolokensis]|uniref:zinc-dependent alcohol dehydrogenase family protein n=1 Tax=Paenibacillus cisolokensis TaxID=1658519 RepID=UPI003D2B395B
MKAFVIEKPFHATIREVPYPKPGYGEVTIKVHNVGICGTDVHIYEGKFIASYPIVPGHEFSGVIHEVGEGVPDLKVGDRVSAEPNIGCGRCAYCLTRRGNLCSNWKGIGVSLDGSMAEYVRVPMQNVLKLPDAMTFEEGAFIEPMACVVYGMNRLQLQVGERVILFGAGAMGQQLVQTIARSGASELVVVDVSREKLDLALRFGATRGVLSRDLSPDDFPGGFDVVVEATGIPSVIEQAFAYMGPGSRYLQFGVTNNDDRIRFSPFDLFNKDWTIIGTKATNQTFYPAFHWIKEGRVDVKPLLSKVIALEDAPAFFSGHKDPGLLKVQIKL